MKPFTRRLLLWTPRILCILFALFISIFALDVFGEGRGFWTTLLALAMHLIPTAIVLIVLALSWRWEWIGGILYILLGILYVVMAWGRFHISAYLGISGPLLVVGVLFLVSWRHRKELHAG